MGLNIFPRLIISERYSYSSIIDDINFWLNVLVRKSDVCHVLSSFNVPGSIALSSLWILFFYKAARSGTSIY